jgi:mannonate dehydratase
MMQRRHFIQTVGVAGSGLASSLAYSAPSVISDLEPRKNPHMRVGGDDHTVYTHEDRDGTSLQNLQFKLRHGVRHITSQVLKHAPDGAWDLDELKRMKDNCDRMGVELECLNLGRTLETQVENQLTPNITLGKSPERDREIEVILGNIRKAGQVGIPAIRYHWRILPIMRSGTMPGRGGSSYTRWDLEGDWQNLPMSKAGRVTEAIWWERTRWFLERVILRP